jgi:tripartite-type tricarboxylate transporter receptor subunit TctC
MHTPLLTLVTAYIVVCADLAHAQGNYPSRALRWIVPFAPGGPADVLARVIGHKLGESWGQQVVIDNRTGAGGNIGTEIVAKAAPDGHTLLLGYVGPLTINPSLYRKMPYDTLKDFAPVTLLATSTLVIAAHPASQIRALKDLIARARASPGALTFGSAGNGSPAHLAGELINAMASVKLTHIPYKGAAPVITDLLGSQVTLGIAALPAVIQHAKAGRLTAVGVSSLKRSIFAPDVPTIAESGLQGYEVENWQGLLLPAGAPQDVVNKLHAEVIKILGMPDVKERLYGQGFEILTQMPAQFGAYLKADIRKWARVVKSSGATVD